WLDEILHQARLSLQGLTTDEQDAIFRRYTFNEVADAAKAWKEVLRRAGAGARGSGEIRRMFVLASEQEAARGEALEQEGKPREDIWREAGVIRDAKGNWLAEIDDSGARFEADPPVSGTLGDYMKHDALYGRYPELKNRPVYLEDMGTVAGKNTKEGLALNYTVGQQEQNQTLLHETQHEVQRSDGRPNGGNPLMALSAEFNRVYEEIKNSAAFRQARTPGERLEIVLDRVRKQHGTNDLEKLSLDLYRNITGEYEAYRTEDRRNMSAAERRAHMPNFDDVIVVPNDVRAQTRKNLQEIGVSLDSLSQLAYNGKKGGEFDENGANRRLAGWTDRAGDTGRGGGIRGNRPQTSSQISTPYTRAAGGAAETDRKQPYVQGFGEWNAPTEAGRGPLRHNLLTEDGRKYFRPLTGDAEYRGAVESGDAETARRLLEEKAAQKGYTAGAEWRMSHRAPGNDGFSQSIDDVREMFGGEQIYSRRAEQLYGEGRDYDWKAIRVIQQMRGKPDADVTVYRAVPKSVKDSRLRKGDWVTTVREYAQEHGGREFSENGGYRVIAETVKARDLYTDGNSIFEWGYDPEGEFAYQNTRNNVKRLEPTYDDEGELIPLSQRFNSRKADERYSRTLAPELAEEHGTIEPGEHPANDVLLPRKDGSGSPVRRTYRTAAESQHADERMQAEIEQVIRDGAASYQVSGDREAADYAEATLSREGFDGARGRWNAALESGKTNKNDIVLGERLYVEAANRGDYQAAREILAQVAAEATIAGQKVQAIRLIKRMGPAGELLTLEHAVRKTQKEIEPKVKKLQKNSSEQIESLKKSVVELENELKPVEKKLEQAKQALDAARAERDRILSLEKSAERKSETANKRASEIGERLPGLQESADRAQATWEQAKQALDAARAERDWLKKRIKSYNNRNATTTNLANELEPKLGELWKQLAEAESSYQKAAEDYEVTREILKQAQKRLASVKNRTESLNRREYSDWWNIQAINEKTEAAKQRYREAVEQFEDTRQKRRALEEMKKRINQLEGKISIPQSVVDDILSQKTQKGLDEAMTRAYAEIGKQVPSNWADKWNAWRYMAMLVNPTTHIRNIFGNLFFRPAIALKDAIKIPMERALMPRYKGDPTAAFLTGSQTDKGYLAQGRESFEENRRMLMSSGKYNPSNEIRDNMRIFQNGVLEAIRRKNGGALEAEDLVFMRRSYVRAYAQVLKANNYAAQDGARQAEIRKQAESWAAEEAWRATYRDASAAADAISRFSRINAATSVVTEGLL
ncbi:MAG: hypothetical protein HPZ89_10240, partial [Oscillospiraceae bacterium]|nr:hypothetical protein [Oscillospiraceae bacterium]